MTKQTWEQIRKAASAAGFYHGWMSAEENAMDTTGAVLGPEFDDVALRSLQTLLAYGSLDKAEHDFLVGLGVEF